MADRLEAPKNLAQANASNAITSLASKADRAAASGNHAEAAITARMTRDAANSAQTSGISVPKGLADRMNTAYDTHRNLAGGNNPGQLDLDLGDGNPPGGPGSGDGRLG